MPDRGPQMPPRHRTKVERIPGTNPRLFGASCLFCAWESESLWTDPEAAEEAAVDHEREANRHA